MLPPKTTSFKAWAEQLQKYAEAEARNELAYWKKVTEPRGDTEL